MCTSSRRWRRYAVSIFLACCRNRRPGAPCGTGACPRPAVEIWASWHRRLAPVASPLLGAFPFSILRLWKETGRSIVRLARTWRRPAHRSRSYGRYVSGENREIALGPPEVVLRSVGCSRQCTEAWQVSGFCTRRARGRCVDLASPDASPCVPSQYRVRLCHCRPWSRP
jgi:hypothetical protein